MAAELPLPSAQLVAAGQKEADDAAQQCGTGEARPRILPDIIVGHLPNVLRSVGHALVKILNFVCYVSCIHSREYNVRHSIPNWGEDPFSVTAN